MASRKRTHIIEFSNSDSSGSDNDYEEECQRVSASQRKTRQPKSFSRNALMARENRLRKKIYMQNLEMQLSKEKTKNKKVNLMLKEQTSVIEKQGREIKYMRSILANNADISKLLKSIHHATGLSVGTSLNKDLTIQRSNFNKSQSELINGSLHPWSDDLLGLSSSVVLNEIDFDLPSIDLPEIDDCMTPASLDDHNYTVSSPDLPEESLGVCLHISNHKVSLECCATCHENSKDLWNEEELPI